MADEHTIARDYYDLHSVLADEHMPDLPTLSRSRAITKQGGQFVIVGLSTIHCRIPRT
jgi:hypothetical protein